MKLTAIIDRLEGDKAILLVRQKNGVEVPLVWPRSFLPPVPEGTILNISLSPDQAATQKALKENQDLLAKIIAGQEG